MRTSLLALLALCAIVVPAAARAEAAAGAVNMQSDDVYYVLTVAVQPGKLEDFKKLIPDLVASAAKEPGTIEYQYNLAPDQQTIDIFERYRGSEGFLAHLKGFGEKFAKHFLEDVKPTRIAVYGTPNEETRKAMAIFNPTFYTPLEGFVRH